MITENDEGNWIQKASVTRPVSLAQRLLQLQSIRIASFSTFKVAKPLAGKNGDLIRSWIINGDLQ